MYHRLHIEAYALGRMQLSEVRVADIDTHISTLIKEARLSESSIEKVVDVLNAAYNWALVRGEVETNPVAPIKPTLVKRMQKMKQKTVDEADVVVLSADEEKRFVQEAMQVLHLIRIECDDERADALIVTTKSGKGNTATNLEHRVAKIFRHAGLTELTGGLHIFRRTFATNMYEKGARVKEIAAYIGDLESATERYYIAIRKKVAVDNSVQQVVQLPMGSQLPGA